METSDIQEEKEEESVEEEEEQKQELPDIWKLPHQDGHLHLDGWDVFQLNDLGDVGQDAVQPAGRRLLGGRRRLSIY